MLGAELRVVWGAHGGAQCPVCGVHGRVGGGGLIVSPSRTCVLLLLLLLLPHADAYCLLLPAKGVLYPTTHEHLVLEPSWCGREHSTGFCSNFTWMALGRMTFYHTKLEQKN